MKVAIDKYLKSCQQAILKDQRDKGIYSSGRSAASTRTESSETKGELWGSDYFQQQKVGRFPGKFPPIEAIIEWIKVKGIQKKDNISDRSLAFLIARKIAKSGTDIYQKKRPGLAIDEIAKRELPELMKSIMDETILTVTAPLKRVNT